MKDLQLIDISDELFILNFNTIETLIHLENADECIALYVVYYRLAKWQKTDTIKATDDYIKKTLKWGSARISRAKSILKNHGLIEIVQNRSDGKINGWFIKVHYMVSDKAISSIKVEQELSNQEHSNQEPLNSRTRNQETIALRNKIKLLKEEIELLKKEKDKSFSKKESESELFNKFWNCYPKKVSKGNAEKWFTKNKPNEDLVNRMVEKLEQLKETDQWKKDNGQFIPYPTTWLNAKGWEDEVQVNDSTPEWIDNTLQEQEATEEEYREIEELLKKYE